MSHLPQRAIVSVILLPYVAALLTFAPPHVHEADADHPRSTAHRHLAPHHADEHDHDHAQLADDDDHIVWLDDATVHQATFQFATPHDVADDIAGPIPSSTSWTATVSYAAAPPHGPPRASASLRAPPHLSA